LLENDEKILIWWAMPASLRFGNTSGDIKLIEQDVLVKTGNDAIRLLDIEVQGKRMRDSQISEYFRKRKVIKLK
jgi:methionyl-tRNA formyltransferase